MSSNKNWGDGSIDWVASHEAYEEFVAEREAGHQAVVPKGEKKKKAKKAIKRAVSVSDDARLCSILMVMLGRAWRWRASQEEAEDGGEEG